VVWGVWISSFFGKFFMLQLVYDINGDDKLTMCHWLGPVHSRADGTCLCPFHATIRAAGRVEAIHRLLLFPCFLTQRRHSPVCILPLSSRLYRFPSVLHAHTHSTESKHKIEYSSRGNTSRVLRAKIQSPANANRNKRMKRNTQHRKIPKKQ
jgi:hypothetical protein